MTTFRTVPALGLEVFCREAGDPGRPGATLIPLESGPFAVEDCPGEIVRHIRDFCGQHAG
jgi:hypothetical protein